MQRNLLLTKDSIDPQVLVITHRRRPDGLAKFLIITISTKERGGL